MAQLRVRVGDTKRQIATPSSLVDIYVPLWDEGAGKWQAIRLQVSAWSDQKLRHIGAGYRTRSHAMTACHADELWAHGGYRAHLRALRGVRKKEVEDGLSGG